MRILWMTTALALAGCNKSDPNTINAFKRILTTTEATFDVGIVAVDDEYPMQIFVQSTGRGDVTIFDVSVDDPDHWLVRDEVWKTTDYDGDGIMDSQTILGASTADPIYGLVEVLFTPNDEDEYRTTLTIESDDTEVTERTDDDHGIWKVVLRGIGRYPCVQIYPDFYDFGKRPKNGYYSATGYIQNCGVVTATVSGFTVEGDASFGVDSVPPIYVLPQGTEPFDFDWVPTTGNAEGAYIGPVVNDPDFADGIEVIGNDCSLSLDETWDANGDGKPDCGGDHSDPLWSDDDGDGYSEREGDCNDGDATIHPGAEETLNEIDDDCNGNVDEGTYNFDDDGDGYVDIGSPSDCNDDDPWTFPGAIEDCDDRDNDCDGLIDEGADDAADGACEFLVGRKTTETGSGCATLPARSASAIWLLLAGIGLLGRRRRE